MALLGLSVFGVSFQTLKVVGSRGLGVLGALVLWGVRVLGVLGV